MKELEAILNPVKAIEPFKVKKSAKAAVLNLPMTEHDYDRSALRINA